MNPIPPVSPLPNPPPDQAPIARRARWLDGVGDDVAYILPMGVFLVLTWAGVQWPSVYAISYVAKTLLAAVLLYALWPRYTRIRWNHAWLGAAMGVMGVVQWVGMERLLLKIWPHFPELAGEPRDLTKAFASPAVAWSFIGLRWAGAVLVVPVMEELFWRDFLWRSVAAPADFRLASVGEWDRGLPLLAVSFAFCVVHPQWLTAIVWGLMVGWLLVYTRSIGACIIMHAVTNFLLGLYVLRTGDWRFW
jgi:CAAX prenyl protease-like protein